MDKLRLQYSARQILIHWRQSQAPLEKLVAELFKETSMGSSERRELQNRLYAWARYWPLFDSELSSGPVDSAKAMAKLNERIAETWDWTDDRWLKAHKKFKPLFLENPRAHLRIAHGVHQDILSRLSDTQLEDFHVYLHAALNEAPFTIRVRNLAAAATLREKYPDLAWESGAFSELCLKTRVRWAATQSEEYQRGNFEIQDESSQLVAPFCGVKSGMKILDLCAGAGGKSLHLASLLNGKGEIHAWDLSHKKLQELQKRARRWNFQNIRALQELPSKSEKYDVVLVDAPCSSLGTLRRRPQLLATTSDRDFVRLVGLQRELLTQAFDRVHPAGLVVYATCSIMPSENYAQVLGQQGTPLEDSALRQFLTDLGASPSAKISTIPAEEFGRSCAQVSSFGNFAGDGFFVARLNAR